MRIEEVIGGRVRQAREARQMTQEDFGAGLGKYLNRPWPRQAVSAAEKGQRSFTAVELLACALTLNCPVADLFRPPAEAFDLVFPSGITVGYVASDPAEHVEVLKLRALLRNFIESAEQSQEASAKSAETARYLFDELDRAIVRIGQGPPA